MYADYTYKYLGVVYRIVLPEEVDDLPVMEVKRRIGRITDRVASKITCVTKVVEHAC